MLHITFLLQAHLLNVVDPASRTQWAQLGMTAQSTDTTITTVTPTTNPQLLNLPPELHSLILAYVAASGRVSQYSPCINEVHPHPYLSLLSLRLTHPLFAYTLLTPSSSLLIDTRDAHISDLLLKEGKEERISSYMEEGWRAIIMSKLRCYGCLKILWAEKDFDQEDLRRLKAERGGPGARERKCRGCKRN